MFTGTGYAATGAVTRLASFSFERRDRRVNDVEIVYRGLCRELRPDRRYGGGPARHQRQSRPLKRDLTPVQVGAPEKPLDVNVFSVIRRRRNFAGSLIGGIAEMPTMRDFCGKPGIAADIEMIPIDQIETAYSRMLKSNVTYRFVIDMAILPKAA